MSGFKKAIRNPLRSLSAASGFLTVFPIFVKEEDGHQWFGPGLYYFPVVGLGIGALAALAAAGLNLVASPLVTGVVLALLLSSVSGFLHLDGLADTADGFLSARSRDRILEIMKDSRIGVMGAAAVSGVLLLKSAALAALGGAQLTGAVIVAATAGRTAMVLAMYFLSYARPEGGTGLLFSGEARHGTAALLSVLVLVGCAMALLPMRLPVLICAFVLVLALFGGWCRNRIGGYTGDTLGCVCELTETAILVAAGLRF